MEGEFALSAVCDILNVSRSGYYAWRDETETERQRADREFAPLVVEIFWRHRRRYGARRIAEELRDRGRPCGVARVAKLLKNRGLRAIQPKSFKPRTTESRHTLGYSPNLLIDREPPTRINEVWVGDITYIALKESGFGYLALVMDLFSRRILAWEFLEEMSERLVLPVLRTAILLRQPAPGLIHHSDRGGQYAGGRYRAVLRRAAMRQSMSRADNCYDNAFMESCFGTIKTELEMADYENSFEARREIGEYISYYNEERKHSSLGYVSPAQFETKQSG